VSGSGVFGRGPVRRGGRGAVRSVPLGHVKLGHVKSRRSWFDGVRIGMVGSVRHGMAVALRCYGSWYA
jgi:hypothetical protein